MLRYFSDTMSEQYRSRRGAPILLRHCVGVGEVLRYCSDMVSESERCSDTIPTRGRSRIGEITKYLIVLHSTATRLLPSGVSSDTSSITTASYKWLAYFEQPSAVRVA